MCAKRSSRGQRANQHTPPAPLAAPLPPPAVITEALVAAVECVCPTPPIAESKEAEQRMEAVRRTRAMIGRCND